MGDHVMIDNNVARLRDYVVTEAKCGAEAYLDPDVAEASAAEIERMRSALIDILRTFNDGTRGAYKARYFSALFFARRALRAKGMSGGYDNVLALLDTAENDCGND